MDTLVDCPAAFATSDDELMTRDGQRLAVRRVTRDDAAALTDFLHRLSSESRRLRYLAPLHFSPDTASCEVARICRGDRGAQLAVVVLAPPPERDAVIAVAEVVPDAHEPTLGHVAVVVRDDYQARGIGTALVRRLLELARASDLTVLRADFLLENHASQRLLDRLGLPYTTRFHHGEVEVRARLPTSPGTAGAAGTG